MQTFRSSGQNLQEKLFDAEIGQAVESAFEVAWLGLLMSAEAPRRVVRSPASEEPALGRASGAYHCRRQVQALLLCGHKTIRQWDRLLQVAVTNEQNRLAD